MEDRHIIWHAEQMANQEKRFIVMIMDDLNKIDKVPLFAIKGKIKSIKKKYLDWQKLHRK